METIQSIRSARLGALVALRLSHVECEPAGGRALSRAAFEIAAGAAVTAR